MASGPVTVKKVYNNNVVLGTEGDGTEVVLLGKGLGFGRKPGESLDAVGGQRFVSDATYRATQLAEMLAGATWEQARVAQRIVDLAHERLGTTVSQAILLPVLDHLTFAVRRADEGVEIEFPLKWEVAQLYPDESALGRRALAIANHALGVRLQSDEWVAFALHFINQRWARGDLSSTLALTDVISTAFNELEQRWGKPIDRASMGAARFVTHLRYLMVRVAEDRQLTDAPMDIMGAIRTAQPNAADAAVRLGDVVGLRLGRTLTSDEVAYLALHAGRLYNDVHAVG
ncbi:PRD domain-containing protein [Propioniciclava coleopterorum]|nr:PRD domain-containing protein [Propioniciclava coleopterorum]